MGWSEHDYIGIYSIYGTTVEFEASSLRELAKKMGVCYQAIWNIAHDKKSRLPIKILKRPKKAKSI